MDLIIYACVAGVLFFMLFRMLGTEADEGPVKRNPFIETPEDRAREEAKKAKKEGKEIKIDATEMANDVSAPDVKGNDAGSVQQTLFQMATIDSHFDAGQFVSNAKEAYRMVVEAFAAGDKDLLKDLLKKHVYEAFDEAIDARNKAGETMDNEIRAIKIADITGASLTKKGVATITVKFTSEQMRAIKNKKGDVIDGNEDYARTLVDEWSFTKDLKDSDPRWFVSETEDDDPSDGPL